VAISMFSSYSKAATFSPAAEKAVSGGVPRTRDGSFAEPQLYRVTRIGLDANDNAEAVCST
jgi:hypothetical protein